MDLGLAGKRALVMSSSRGLGRGIAEGLAREGANVVLTARSVDRLDEAAAAINARGAGRAYAVPADLAAGVDALHEKAVAALGGPIDILIGNSGGPPAATALAVDEAVWTPQFQAMVLPILRMASLCLPAMRKAQSGRILVVGSSGIEQPIPNLVVSNALRAAIRGWAKTLAAEVAAEGVTVNMILPGRIRTDRTGELDSANAARQGKSVEEIEKAALATIPAGRYGDVAEFADAACFLASARAGYITGSAIRVDGGAIRSV